MNKRVSRVVKVINDSVSMNACMKFLNLEINSYFLCLLNIIEDAIIDYKDGYDYSYLLKIADYLEIISNNLTNKVRKDYRGNILILRKVCKKMQGSLIKKDRLYFEKLYESLNKLIINNKKEVLEYSMEDIDLYDFIEEVIFKMQKLEYLDRVIEKFPGILNSERDSYPIFIDVINEYIKQIVTSNEDMINYYERVINKFLLEETFNLSEEMKD